MTKQHTHTPGALRAARAQMKLERVYAGMKESDLNMLAQSRAELIDRETALPELLEALQACEAELVTLKARLPEPFRTNVTEAAKLARAALAKATTPEGK